MGIYLFERCTSDGAGQEAGTSLRDDVARALDEIDWVENYTLRDDGGEDGVVVVDVVFDEQWPDIRTSNPDQVSEVFDRLGLRTLVNPALAASQVSADDPLSAAGSSGDDVLELFDFDEETLGFASN